MLGVSFFYTLWFFVVLPNFHFYNNGLGGFCWRYDDVCLRYGNAYLAFGVILLSIRRVTVKFVRFLYTLKNAKACVFLTD
ncbi:MAG: hypothetical protein COA75_02000 [Cellvibrionales bacterium]|nr:MAG: hypothetical protein COA75_02000 [Cellvibrionales bacterium]